MPNYAILPIGEKLDKGDIQVCPHCGKHGLATEICGKTFYTHRYGIFPCVGGTGEIIDETCPASFPKESPESAEPN
jgi:hypothetical protein